MWLENGIHGFLQTEFARVDSQPIVREFLRRYPSVNLTDRFLENAGIEILARARAVAFQCNLEPRLQQDLVEMKLDECRPERTRDIFARDHIVNRHGETIRGVQLGGGRSIFSSKPELPTGFLGQRWYGMRNARDNEFAQVIDGQMQAELEALQQGSGHAGFTRSGCAGNQEDWTALNHLETLAWAHDLVEAQKNRPRRCVLLDRR